MSAQGENGKVWGEGVKAYADGIKETDCPYDMTTQWGDWVDWICGHGAASHEAFTKEMHKEARAALTGQPKKFVGGEK